MHPNDPNISPNVFLCAPKLLFSDLSRGIIVSLKFCVVIVDAVSSSLLWPQLVFLLLLFFCRSRIFMLPVLLTSVCMFRYYSFTVNFYVANDDDDTLTDARLSAALLCIAMRARCSVSSSVQFQSIIYEAAFGLSMWISLDIFSWMSWHCQ